ncbi:MAG TPA: aminotransferase class V-fold PLP-dependent enzyme [Cyclobacteriaceae bacterium]|nr:aminotransferase class V-fold PLP-dependent enzyme [Cyclobacteriaceae bacterium]
MISFYPGPSRVHDEIPSWVEDAHKKGILSMNHRSPEFIDLYKKTVKLLKKKLNIPDDYAVYFTSSATECWEIIAQSLIKSKSYHLHNGAFGEKWFDYTRKLHAASVSIPFEVDQSLKASEQVFSDGEVICITQNETSNGTQVAAGIIDIIKKNNTDHLVAVDATSSMAGVRLKFETADIWFASVQKCFGLPAGLGIMICSPEAVKKMEAIGEASHYNSLTLVHSMMEKWQTSCTPNVMGIYLLKCALKKMDKIDATEKKLSARLKKWNTFFSKSKNLKVLVRDPAIQSKTVLAVKGTPKLVETVKAAAKKQGLLLGEGYGKMKAETFRIANFPALKKKEIEKLIEFLKPYA